MPRPLSHSASELYQLCQKRFMFAKELHLEPIEERAESLRMGGALAHALEHHDPMTVFELYEDEHGGEWENDIDLLTEAKVVHLYAEEYLRRYQPSDSEAREVEFNHPVLGRGFLDRVYFASDGALVGVDDKLLTKGPWFDDAALGINRQITRYFAAMRAEGTPLDRFEYRVQWKPTIKRNTRTNESVDAYIERLRDRMQGDPEYAFKRYIQHRSDEQLDDFIAEAEHMNAERLRKRRQFKRTQDDTIYPRNDKACGAFGRRCPFEAACHKLPGWESQYRVKPKPPKVTPAGRVLLDTIKQSLTEWVVVDDLAKQAGVNRRGAGQSLTKLHRDKLVTMTEHEGRKVVALTEMGRRA